MPMATHKGPTNADPEHTVVALLGTKPNPIVEKHYKNSFVKTQPDTPGHSCRVRHAHELVKGEDNSGRHPSV